MQLQDWACWEHLVPHRTVGVAWRPIPVPDKPGFHAASAVYRDKFYVIG